MTTSNIADLGRVLNSENTTQDFICLEKERNNDQKFIVELAPFEFKEFKEMQERHTKEKWNTKLHVKEKIIDKDALDKEVAVKYVKSWKGLTPTGLCNLLPFEFESENRDDIKFNKTNLEFLLDHSTEFSMFVTKQIDDPSAFSKLNENFTDTAELQQEEDQEG